MRAPRPPPPEPEPGLPPPALGLPDAGLTEEPASPSSTDAPPATATDGPMYRRTEYCWATVHRFVVIQYSIRPAGKRITNSTKISGMKSMIFRCVGSIVEAADITSVELIWDPM